MNSQWAVIPSVYFIPFCLSLLSFSPYDGSYYTFSLNKVRVGNIRKNGLMTLMCTYKCAIKAAHPYVLNYIEVYYHSNMSNVCVYVYGKDFLWAKIQDGQYCCCCCLLFLKYKRMRELRLSHLIIWPTDDTLQKKTALLLVWEWAGNMNVTMPHVSACELIALFLFIVSFFSGHSLMVICALRKWGHNIEELMCGFPTRI